MSDPNDAAALTAVVLDEEEARRRAQAEAEAGEILPDDLLPGVGGPPMRLRAGLASGGYVMIFALLLVSMIETLDQVALQVLAPDIQRTLDVDKTTLQGLISLGGVVLVVATLPFAWLADRYVRTRILAAATFVWAAFMALTGFVTTGLQMAVARAGAGFGGSARIPITPALIADQYPIDVRTRMFAMENLGRPAGLVVGPFFVGAVAGWAGGVEGWRWAMFAVAIPAVIVAIVLLFTARTRARSQRAGSDPRAAPRHLGGPAGSPQLGGGAPPQGQELPLSDPRDRCARVRARERAGAPQLPARRDLPLRRVQARLGAVTHLPARAARDPVRGSDGRPALSPRPAELRTDLRRAGHRVRRLPHDRLATQRHRALHRPRGDRRTRANSPRSPRWGPRSPQWFPTACARRRSR